MKRKVLIGLGLVLTCGAVYAACSGSPPERLGNVSAREMCSIYDELHGGNEVTGDLRFKGKQADVSGVVIKAPYYRGFGNEVVIDLEGQNECRVQAVIKSEKIGQVEGIKVGSPVVVGCVVQENERVTEPGFFAFKRYTKVNLVDCIMVKR